MILSLEEKGGGEEGVMKTGGWGKVRKDGNGKRG